MNNDQLANNNNITNNSFSNINTNYQTSANFLLSKIKTYPVTKDFNSIEHTTFRDFYKKEFLDIDDININSINWDHVYNYWNNMVDKEAAPNSINKIRPKSIENLQAHFLILNNYYLRKKIESTSK